MSDYAIALVALVASLASFVHAAPAPPLLWVTQAGGVGSDEALGLAGNVKGNTYWTGYFQQTALFGNTNLTSQGLSDIFVSKCDALGHVVWAKHALTPSGLQSRGYAAASDNNDNCYITGSFEGTTSFDQINLSTDGNDNMFVAKYDSSGNVVWAKRAGGRANQGYGVVADSSGNVYVTGSFTGAVNFDSTNLTSASSGYDVFTVKLNSFGSALWAQQGGGNGNNAGESIALDGTGDCFVAGHFQNTATFAGLVLTNSGGNDAFVAKYDGLGSVQWVKRIGSAGEDYAHGVAADPQGNCYIVGSFSSTFTIGTSTLTNRGGQDVFVSKYDSGGNLIWTWTAGGTNDDVATAVIIDSSGRCCVAGNFSGTADFGITNLVSAGASDVFVVELDTNGSPQWVVQGGGPGIDTVKSISVESNSLFCIAGAFSGTNVYQNGQSVVSAGGLDAYIATYSGKPIIINQPVGQTASAGDTVMLSVNASAQMPLFYQWIRNGIAVDGATNQSFTISNLQFSTSGQYSVLLSNAIGTTISSNAAVIVNDNGDLNSNGIPNWWEALYGLDPSNPANATNYPAGDRLTYLEKYLFDLNPLTTDSDGDGISDYDEVFVYHSNPVSANTSGDGIPDGWKLANGVSILASNASSQIGSSGLTILQVYQYDLSHSNQISPTNLFPSFGATAYELIYNGQHTNRYYYDREDRLTGVEYSRGASVGYFYDGNGNPVQQTVLPRSAETNGIPVLWLAQHGLTNRPGVAYEDADGDGWSNFQEWQSGTDPNDSSSAPIGYDTSVTPIAWWPAEGNAMDSIGGNNGQLKKAATFTVGEIGQAFSFDGNNSYVLVPDTPALRFTNGLTVTAWVYSIARSTDVQEVLSKWYGPPGTDERTFVLELDTNGVAYFGVCSDGKTNSGYAIGSVPLPLSQWIHLAGTYDGQTVSIYINGQLTVASSFVSTNGAFPGNADVGIGALSDGSQSLFGRVDEAQIFNRSLSSNQIAEIYRAESAGISRSSFANNETAPMSQVLPSSYPLGPIAVITNRVWHAQGANCSMVVQYQLSGLTNWTKATITALDTILNPSNRVAALPTGSNHALTWNVMQDLGNGIVTNVLLRSRAADSVLTGDWSVYPTPFQINMTQDSNTNGIPDWWEYQYFGRLLQSSGENDLDQDGFSNVQEYIADTNPMDSNSVPRLTSMQLLSNTFGIYWTAGTQSRQILQSSLSLSNAVWKDIWTNQPPTAVSGSYTDFVSTNTTRFYRLRFERP